jgi:hypothetical protein
MLGGAGDPAMSEPADRGTGTCYPCQIAFADLIAVERVVNRTCMGVKNAYTTFGGN